MIVEIFYIFIFNHVFMRNEPSNEPELHNMDVFSLEGIAVMKVLYSWGHNLPASRPVELSVIEGTITDSDKNPLLYSLSREFIANNPLKTISNMATKIVDLQELAKN